MAQEDETEISTSKTYDFTFNKRQDAFDDLLGEFKKIDIKNSLLKNMLSTLTKECEDL